jgi:integrase
MARRKGFEIERRAVRSGQNALSESELSVLFSKIAHLEDEALLRLTVSTGMRREDIVTVERTNLDLDGGVVRFWERKKSRPWRAWIGPDTIKVLRQHLNTLPNGTKWVFPSPRKANAHISSRHAYDVLQGALQIAGLRQRPFHALRATCVKVLQKRGWSIEQVMEQTGDSFDTIKEHYDTPTEEEMREAARTKGL